MDRLAERHGKSAPWPDFADVRLATIAAGLGCPARRVEDHAELLAVLDEVVPGLRGRSEPLLLEVAVAADPTFEG
jgi:benzoylformate decarboxylase